MYGPARGVPGECILTAISGVLHHEDEVILPEGVCNGRDLRGRWQAGGAALRNSGLLLSFSMVKMTKGFRHEIHTRKIGDRTGRKLASTLVLS